MDLSILSRPGLYGGMKKGRRMGHYNSFLVKIWADDNEKLVRGQIQHVGSRDIIYFRTWKKMVGFITERLGLNGESHTDSSIESKLPGSIKGE